ncbi:MAG: GNAT family N-acetyltransferase [Pseudomonadota bacterium]
MTKLVPLDRIAPDAVEALLDRAFGADRHGRTAYLVRAGTQAVPALSFAALRDDGRLAGSIQCWPVALTCDDGTVAPLTMVGPVAVEPEWQQEGIGRELMAHMIAAAIQVDAPPLMLIGDPEYYGRFFGFTAERTGGWRLPGAFEPRRLLARGDAAPACAGMVGPRLPAHA